MIVRRLVGVSVIFLLGSCTVNMQERRDPNDWRQQSWSTNSRPSPEGVEAGQLTNCPVYVPPETKSAPKAPTEEFRSAGKSQAKREEALLDYIEELREYIKDYKTVNTDSYLRYLQQCTRVRSK